MQKQQNQLKKWAVHPDKNKKTVFLRLVSMNISFSLATGGINQRDLPKPKIKKSGSHLTFLFCIQTKRYFTFNAFGCSLICFSSSFLSPTSTRVMSSYLK